MWFDALSLSVILLILKAVAERLPEALLRNLSRRMWPASEAVPNMRLKFSIARRSLLAARYGPNDLACGVLQKVCHNASGERPVSLFGQLVAMMIAKDHQSL